MNECVGASPKMTDLEMTDVKMTDAKKQVIETTDQMEGRETDGAKVELTSWRLRLTPSTTHDHFGNRFIDIADAENKVNPNTIFMLLPDIITELLPKNEISVMADFICI